MFPRRERLSREAFPPALAGGRRFISPHFTAILPGGTQKGYAVVVPKKVARLSVTRHHVKRQILEALRTIPLPKALILFPKATVLSLGYKDIQLELAVLLSKIRN